MSIKEDIIDRINIILESEGVNADIIAIATSRITLLLKDYVIERGTTDLAIRDSDEDVIMIKKFILSKKLKGCSDKTITQYTNELKRTLPRFRKELKKITVDDVRWLMADKEFNEGCSRVTCGNSLRILSSFFEFLTIEEYINVNPVKQFGVYKIKRTKKKAFTEYEIESMRENITDPKTKCIFEMLLSTGCRVSELAQIKKQEINGDEILVHGKGGKDRIVHMNAKAQKALETYLGIKCSESKKSIWLFPKNEHKNTVTNPEEHINKSSIESRIRTLGSSVSVQAYPHKFRRTCATLALRRGMDLMYVSKMLGHDSVQTTQIYLDLDEETLKEQHKKFVI